MTVKSNGREGRKLRLIAVTLQPQFVLDDGETLVPVPTNAMTITAADWPAVAEQFAKAVESLKVELGV